MRLIDFLLVSVVAASAVAVDQVFRAPDPIQRPTPTATPLAAARPVRSASGVVTTPAAGPCWRFIVVHHSGTRRGSAALFARSRGGAEALPYHYVIGNGVDSGDGEIELTARGLYRCPGPQTGDAKIDDWALGICLVGNFEDSPPTPKQLDALNALVRRLVGEYGIDPKNVLGERELAGGHTACPGKRLSLDAVRKVAGAAQAPAPVRVATRRGPP